MITEAIVIGAVEAAIFREDDTLRAVRLDSRNDKLIDCSRDIGFLLSSRAEKRKLAQPPQDLIELGAHLRRWAQRHHALTMMISGMDGELADETRQSCILAANRSLYREPTAKFVRARMLACPIVEEADLSGALRVAFETKSLTQKEMGDFSRLWLVMVWEL